MDVKGKKFNMAEAAGYRDALVFDCQVEAHKIFFEDKLPSRFQLLSKEDWPSNMPDGWTGIVYDITGFHGQQVEDKLPSGFQFLPKEDWPSSMPNRWTGIVYDITGFHGQQVVALLSLKPFTC